MSASLPELLGELEERIRKLQQLPYEQAREEIFEALQLVDRIHRPGVSEVARALAEAGILERALESEAIHTLLSLYDEVPLDRMAQAERALDAVRPYIDSHGGQVEVVAIDGGEVHVRLSGACDSCSASPETLRQGVEEALREGLEGFERLVESRPVTTGGDGQDELVQIASPSFLDLIDFGDLADSAPTVIETAGRKILVVRMEDEVFAFEPECPGCGAELADGLVSRAVLVCPFQNCAFKVRTGRRVDGMGASGLRAYPVRVAEDGRVLVAPGVEPTERLVSQ